MPRCRENMIPGSVCEGDSGRSGVIACGPNKGGTLAGIGGRHPLGVPAQQGGAEVRTPSFSLTWDIQLLPLMSVLLVPRWTMPGSQASRLDGPHRQLSWAPSFPGQWWDFSASAGMRTSHCDQSPPTCAVAM